MVIQLTREAGQREYKSDKKTLKNLQIQLTGHLVVVLSTNLFLWKSKKKKAVAEWKP